MRILSALSLAVLLAACAGDPEDDFGIDDTLSPLPPGGKEDNAGRAGPRVATDTSATQVWTAKNAWEDTSTTSARAAGLAWPANSGLTWDQKFSAWVSSLPEVVGTDGYVTFQLTTPWGKSLPAPVLECAETAIFLRATFAAWYNLPFFMESQDSHGNRVYFGHFGIRTASGRYANTPNFAYQYKDYSSWTQADLDARGWPHDTKLRTKAATGLDDAQPAIGADHFGAYLDEAHLNKRAGYLIIYLVNYFGSMNLVDTSNTYNLLPATIRSGDLLMHRWQKDGIGDTKNIKFVGTNDAGDMIAKVMSGSMPRRQPKLYDETQSKEYFTEDDTGGPDYAAFGGGAKRWRVTKNVRGYWTNTWMSADEADWIDSTDMARLTARPAEFAQLLGDVTPAEKAVSLRRQIADARDHLMQYPASCAARQTRERAFHELYEISWQINTTPQQIDANERSLADYVFAELDYTNSKTCCWDSSSSAMAQIIMDYASAEQQGQCKIPTVFMSQTDGYARWAQWAADHGTPLAWKTWSEDEPCPQRAVATDSEVPHEATAYCSR